MSWNIEGFWKQKSLLDDLLRMNKIDLCCTQEVKTKYFTESEATEEGNYFHHFNTEEKYFDNMSVKMRKCLKTSKWGCGISVRKREKKEWKFLETNNHRFNAVVWDEKILVMGVYLPCNHNDKQDDEKLKDVIEDMLRFIKENGQSLEYVITGDFNISDNQNSFRNEQKQLLKDVLDLTEVRPVGPTNFHHTGTETLLDYCLHSKGVKIEDMSRIMDIEGNESTHVPITFRMVYKKEIKKEEVKPKTKKKSIVEPRRKINWQNTDISLFRSLADKYLKAMNIEMSDAPNPVLIKTACDLIYKAAHRSRRKFRRPRTAERNKVQSFLRKNIKHARIDNNVSLKNRLLRQLKSRVRFDLKVKRREKYKELMSSLKRGDSKTFYSKLKKRTPMVTPDSLVYGGKTYDSEHILDCFTDMTEDQSKDFRLSSDDIDHRFVEKKRIVDLAEERCHEDESTVTPFNIVTWRKVLRDLPRNKAADIYGTNQESFAYLDEEASLIVMNLFNGVLQDLRSYSDTFLSMSLAHFLHKGKGRPKNVPKSYRRITISSFSQKVMEKFFSYQTSRILHSTQSDLQWGFTPKTSFLSCVVARETLMMYSHENRRRMIQLATDVENAFSMSCRVSQLYELLVSGLDGKLFCYVTQTYQNTITVVRFDGVFSDLVYEWRGSKQGAIEAPAHYKSYDSPLIRMMTNAKCGFELSIDVDTGDILSWQLEYKDLVRFGKIVKDSSLTKVRNWTENVTMMLPILYVADDGVSLTSSVEGLKVIDNIYSWYGTTYATKFGKDKSQFNVYGADDPTEATFGGYTLGLAEESVHLGTMVTQDPTRTMQVNIDARIQKTKKSFWSIMGTAFHTSQCQPTEVSIKILKTVIIPRLCSGLHSMSMTFKQMNSLDVYFNEIVRNVLSFRRNSSIHGVLDILKIDRPSTFIMNAALQLLWNIWTQKRSRVLDIILLTLHRKIKTGYYWTDMIQMILKRLKMPDARMLLCERPPSKQSWKMYVKEKIAAYNREQFRKKLTKSQIHLDIEDMYRGDSLWQDTETYLDVRGSKVMMMLLMNEYLTSKKLYDIKMIDSPNCDLCGEDDIGDISHLLLRCAAIKADNRVNTAMAAILSNCEQHTGSEFSELSDLSKIQYLINPDREYYHSCVIPEETLRKEILKRRRLCYWIDQNVRRSRQEAKVRDPKPRKRGAHQISSSGWTQSTKTGRMSKPGNGQTQSLIKFLIPNPKAVSNEMGVARDKIKYWRDFATRLEPFERSMETLGTSQTILAVKRPSALTVLLLYSHDDEYRLGNMDVWGHMVFKGASEGAEQSKYLVYCTKNTSHYAAMAMDYFPELEQGSEELFLNLAPIIIDSDRPETRNPSTDLKRVPGLLFSLDFFKEVTLDVVINNIDLTLVCLIDKMKPKNTRPPNRNVLHRYESFFSQAITGTTGSNPPPWTDSLPPKAVLRTRQTKANRKVSADGETTEYTPDSALAFMVGIIDMSSPGKSERVFRTLKINHIPTHMSRLLAVVDFDEGGWQMLKHPVEFVLENLFPKKSLIMDWATDFVENSVIKSEENIDVSFIHNANLSPDFITNITTWVDEMVKGYMAKYYERVAEFDENIRMLELEYEKQTDRVKLLEAQKETPQQELEAKVKKLEEETKSLNDQLKEISEDLEDEKVKSRRESRNAKEANNMAESLKSDLQNVETQLFKEQAKTVGLETKLLTKDESIKTLTMETAALKVKLQKADVSQKAAEDREKVELTTLKENLENKTKELNKMHEDHVSQVLDMQNKLNTSTKESTDLKKTNKALMKDCTAMMRTTANIVETDLARLQEDDDSVFSVTQLARGIRESTEVMEKPKGNIKKSPMYCLGNYRTFQSAEHDRKRVLRSDTRRRSSSRSDSRSDSRPDSRNRSRDSSRDRSRRDTPRRSDRNRSSNQDRPLEPVASSTPKMPRRRNVEMPAPPTPMFPRPASFRPRSPVTSVTPQAGKDSQGDVQIKVEGDKNAKRTANSPADSAEKKKVRTVDPNIITIEDDSPEKTVERMDAIGSEGSALETVLREEGSEQGETSATTHIDETVDSAEATSETVVDPATQTVSQPTPTMSGTVMSAASSSSMMSLDGSASRDARAKLDLTPLQDGGELKFDGVTIKKISEPGQSPAPSTAPTNTPARITLQEKGDSQTPGMKTEKPSLQHSDWITNTSLGSPTDEVDTPASDISQPTDDQEQDPKDSTVPVPCSVDSIDQAADSIPAQSQTPVQDSPASALSHTYVTATLGRQIKREIGDMLSQDTDVVSAKVVWSSALQKAVVVDEETQASADTQPIQAVAQQGAGEGDGDSGGPSL